MNKYSKLAEGLAAWLTFEQRCGRTNLFSESSLAHPLGQLLQYRYPGRVRAEVEHPVLTPLHKGVGQKPRIDFAVEGSDGVYDLVVETKWVSGSPTPLRDILRDFVRLDLLLGPHSRDALFILAGQMKAMRKLFDSSHFRADPTQVSSRTILPIAAKSGSIRFASVAKFRKALYTRALDPFAGLELSRSIYLRPSGPFPRNANSASHRIYVWRLVRTGNGPTFLPENEYPAMRRDSQDVVAT